MTRGLSYRLYPSFFLNGPPNCGDVDNHVIFQGVRCKGCVDDPPELEFNNSVGHYTIYKNIDYGLFTTDDKEVGQCNVDKSDHFQSSNLFSQAGDSIIFCKASFNADKAN
ncbi:hypothetical protein ETB97_001159 [Aspergillus alliaceus]|uniref:Uncharacterized protein n=1 Tax=Petromyces alliaceus TaxID=209559 RepID=A0A8H6ACJ7_PETAA|nr:hypothetical protein ETB97_001159 [Aspergillus burnettii]